MATPAYGTITLQNPQSKVTHAVDIYASDVAAGLVNWDEGNGANSSSQTNFTMPLSGYIVDICMSSAIVDCAMFQLIVDSQPSGDFFRVDVNHLYSSWRPPVRIYVPKGKKIGFIQRA